MDTLLPELTMDDAINIINRRDHDTQIAQAEVFFTKRVQLGKGESLEEEGKDIFYLLRCKLSRNILYETKDMVELYHTMRKHFFKAERQYLKASKTGVQIVVAKIQLEAFYRLMGYYFGSLEQLYFRHNFDDRAHHAYEDKMHFRRKQYFFQKKWSHWFAYSLINVTSKYGNSFGRYSMTAITAVIAFGSIYAILDGYLPLGQTMLKIGGNFYDYFYYSIVTFMTLGYGDILPVSGLQKLVASLEVISGYFMLGIFINLLNRKL